MGSSTLEFRTENQPFINDFLFRLKSSGINICHLDIKDDIGIDIVGDITDKEVISKINKFNPEIILLSNLLEHIEKRDEFITNLLKIIKQNTLLIVTVPYKFPYHADPIDTMFRPSPEELAIEFPSLRLIQGIIISGGLYPNFSEHLFIKKSINNILSLIRLFAPFYHPSTYLETIKKRFLNTKVTIAVFIKQ